MTHEIAKDKERLEQAKTIAMLTVSSQLDKLLDVYLNEDTDTHYLGLFCGFIPSNHVGRSLQKTSWDLTAGDGGPGSIQYRGRIEYFRHGNDDGIEPLVLYRSFYGSRSPYLELCEEFRLFHGLFHDKKTDRYYSFDDSGNEQLVASVEPNCVKIRLREIRQFLAIREMHLAVFIDRVEKSRFTLKQLGLEEGGDNYTSDLIVYGLHYGDYDGIGDKEAFSRVLGKRLIPPLPKEKSGFPGYAEEEPRKKCDFIIGVDADGNEILNTSDERRLNDYFNSNPGQEEYLTPVFFRKAVLDKYYQQPSRYSVETGYLRCAGLWGISIDNHQNDYVVVWLGDLGRDLPPQEQQYWKSFNVPPAGKRSDTFFRQQILSQWVDTNHPEHLFKSEYALLAKDTQRLLGWPLLLPLSKDDEHYLRSLRVPATEEQHEFDEVILALTKILVDSLNEKELNRLIRPDDVEGLKGGISRLEKVFEKYAVPNYTEQIRFLRDLQELRSSGVAHRKGENYRRTVEKLGLDAQTLRVAFEQLLLKGLNFLRFLKSASESGGFGVPVE